MTTKPKANKFRIRRTEQAAEAKDTAEASQAAPAEPEPAAAAKSEPTETPQPKAGAKLQTGLPAEAYKDPKTVDFIRKEGLSGRQLRMARRLAQKNNLAPTSDFDAVRLLRMRNIDPFQRSNIVSLVPTDAEQNKKVAEAKIQLPQTVPAEDTNLPSTEVSPAQRRAQDIQAIQKDIAQRRRRKMMLLLSRLTAFVFLPTLVAGYYYYTIATPMYTTKTEFLILTADGGGGGGGGGLGGLLPSQFATGQDSIATQSYLQSKDAMLRLDSDVGFMDHFSQDSIDPIQRLDEDASTESAYKVYKKYVKLGYDPTEGVIRLDVSTADPELSKVYSEKLITYAEERVDDLSAEKRSDAVRTAIQSLEEAKQNRRDAQRTLVKLQEGTILDPDGEIANIRTLIGNVELRLQEKQLALNTLLANARPNQARVTALASEIALLDEELAKQNARLTQAAEGSSSLASKASEIQIAQADLASADLFLQSALETKRLSEIEANKQVRYLTVSVNPVASEDPSFPRSFENTLLAFLIFSGIYLMLSLTASVLREQISS
ncbi:MAG: capsule biosynthesis protein [Pseudomonadota bacterium]